MATQVKTACYHCGEDCGSEPVMFDEKPFCCYGCKTVYEILKESDACDYYSIDRHPGIRSRTIEIGNRYAYLDNEEIRDSLLEFSDGGVSKVTFFIPSIHCSSCIWLLENLARLQEGIIQSTVNFIKKKVTITYREEKISLRNLVELLASINYIPQITLDTLNDSTKKKTDRSIYYKLGVAGFCFGNIMLFSFPEYLAVDNVFEEGLRRNFSWLNLLLSLPVMFYASTGYLVSAWKGLKKKIVNIDVPIALGIIVLFTRSAYEIVSGTGAGYMDSLSGLVFFLLIGKWYQGKTYQALSFERDYNSYFPVAVTVLDNEGRESHKPLKKIKTGDRILVRNQELIPADGILVKGDANIDYSFVSGESTPVPKKLKERIFAGGRQAGSAIELIVEKEVTQSYLTELWNQDPDAEKNDSGITEITNLVGRYFTIAIITIAGVAGATWLWLDPSVAMNAFTSILIVACPCALALTVPFAFGSAMRIFGRNGFYLRKTDVVEHLAKTDAIIFDKTGTITRNDDFEVDFSALKADDTQLSAIREVVRHSTHPLSIAIYRNIPGNGKMNVTNFSEEAGSGVEGKVGSNHIRLGSVAFAGPGTGTDNSKSTRIYASVNGHPCGFIRVSNKYRDGLKEVIARLEQSHELHLLSGDNDAEKPSLMPLFNHREERLHFNQAPVDKLNYIRDLRKKHNTLMIGDGLNDAGALKESDTGITIADDIYHFSPACDAILESDKFSMLASYIRFSGTVMKVVIASFIISFLYNIVGITFAAMGYLTPIISAILMPLSSVSVVAFVTIATSLLARKAGIYPQQA